MSSKWFEKRAVSNEILKQVGIERFMWEVLASKINESDAENVSSFLSINKDVMLSLFYTRCEAPTGSNHTNGKFN